MSFVSYAQNYEDVMLRRALRQVRQGFYIDVGAQDPVVDSVTKAFYEQGWRGINVEPVAAWHEKLVADRPGDINLRIALGADEGETTLYEIPGTGLSTSDPAFAQQHQRDGREAIASVVRTRTLDAVCREHGVSVVHFLKIDVEGAERAVLEGFSFGVRPWVVLVEATLPNTQIPAYEDWEGLLTGRNYRLAYVDGLNRFYIDADRPELAEAFAVPPNVFDQFVRFPEWRALVELQQAREEHQRLAATQNLLEARERAAAAEAARDAAKALELELRGSIAALTQMTNAQAVQLQDIATAEAALRQHATAVEAELHRAEAAGAELRQAMADLEAALQRAEAVETALRQEVGAMEAELRRGESVQAALREQATAAEEEALALAQQLRSALDARDQGALEIERLRLDAARVAGLEAELAQARSEARVLAVDLAQRDCEIAGLSAELQQMLHSHSWALTRPLRGARRQAGRARAAARRMVLAALRPPLAMLASRAAVRGLGRRLLAGQPELTQRLLRWSGRLPEPADAGVAAAAPLPRMTQDELTPRALRILQTMQAATRDAAGDEPGTD